MPRDTECHVAAGFEFRRFGGRPRVTGWANFVRSVFARACLHPRRSGLRVTEADRDLSSGPTPGSGKTRTPCPASLNGVRKEESGPLRTAGKRATISPVVHGERDGARVGHHDHGGQDRAGRLGPERERPGEARAARAASGYKRR